MMGNLILYGLGRWFVLSYVMRIKFGKNIYVVDVVFVLRWSLEYFGNKASRSFVYLRIVG